jgi:uncharacterized protein (DUF2062 family)
MIHFQQPSWIPFASPELITKVTAIIEMLVGVMPLHHGPMNEHWKRKNHRHSREDQEVRNRKQRIAIERT